MGRNSHQHRSSACGIVRLSSLIVVTVAAQLCLAPNVAGQQPATREGAPAASQIQRIAIVLARETRNVPPPLSLLDMPPPDDGVAGARLAIDDNNTTGRFLKQEFTLDVVQSGNPQELVSEVEKRVEAGVSFIVADTGPQTVIALADRLAQYLAWKRWKRWFLLHGVEPGDAAYAEALRRAAKRFGAKIVEERPVKYEVGSRRADGGHEQIQEQMATLTQSVPAYDVAVVADESGVFGEYLPYRTWDARPVAGTQGLTPTSWHPALEQWGATQLQNRFRRLANRAMRPLDYDAWVAVRSIGEAAARARSTGPADMIAHLKSADFDLAAFKGRKLSYRPWDGQLRQPILIATAKLPVTVSPQPAFLHQFTELDTLGIDKPESTCRAYA